MIKMTESLAAKTIMSKMMMNNMRHLGGGKKIVV